MSINNLKINDIGENKYLLKLSPSLAKVLLIIGICVVIEAYNNGNNWYRIWSDGWIEQGGQIATSGDGTFTVTLLKKMKDTNYSISLTCYANSTGYKTSLYNSQTINNFKVYSYGSSSQGTITKWEVKGFIA